MNARIEKFGVAAIVATLLLLTGFALRSPAAQKPPQATSKAAPTTTAKTTPTSSPSPTKSAAAQLNSPRIAFIGDSFVEGKGVSAPAKKWTTIVAAKAKAAEINLGHAGTGYVKTGKAQSCGTSACPNFVSTATEAVRAQPQTVIITGGANDKTATPAQVANALITTVATIKKGLPKAKIYVVNPWWDLRPVTTNNAAVAAAIPAAAKKGGATYLDTGQPVAGVPALMLPGGSAPNDQGHASLAAAVEKALSKAASK